jgi:hypothetical protein
MKHLLLLLPMLVLLAPAPLRSQVSSRAGVVVRFGDGSVRTRCVDFNDETITGLELLQRSGVDVIAQTAGGSAAVCKIGPDGCNFPAESCLACKFGAGGQGEYWAYWQLVGNEWRYSQLGAGSRKVKNGEVDGWAYGPGNVQTGAQPPVVTFEEICPALQPITVPPTRVPPTAVPATAAPKPRPTSTLVPQPTPKPTVRPTLEPTKQPQSTQAIIASVPTVTPEPPTAIPTTTSTAQPTATAAATSTAAPTTTATTAIQPSLTPAVPPTQTPVVAGAASDSQAETNLFNYVVFGAMVTVILGALGVALRRRTR